MSARHALNVCSSVLKASLLSCSDERHVRTVTIQVYSSFPFFFPSFSVSMYFCCLFWAQKLIHCSQSSAAMEGLAVELRARRMHKDCPILLGLLALELVVYGLLYEYTSPKCAILLSHVDYSQ